MIKWRTGSEGRIATLKRGYGWGRSFRDSLGGTQVWCGYGILAHNSQKVSGLVADKRLPAKGPGPPEKRPKPVGNGAPPRSGPPPVLPIPA